MTRTQYLWVMRRQSAKGAKQIAKVARAYPMNRITTHEDVASMIVYFGSAANGHVNGEHIRVTGKGSQPLLNVLMKEFRARNQ